MTKKELLEENEELREENKYLKSRLAFKQEVIDTLMAEKAIREEYSKFREKLYIDKEKKNYE